MNTIHPGDLHFTNGTHFPVLVPGLTADGVFINSFYYITKWERSAGKTTLSRAKNYCKNRGCVLPDFEAHSDMKRYRVVINESLQALGFPLLKDGEYWLDYDAEIKKNNMDLATCDYEELGDVIDDALALGHNPNDPRYVRGCVKITRDPKIVYCSVNVAKDEEGTVLSSILNDFGVARYDFLQYLSDKNLYPQSGDYLLKNGTVSKSTVYDQEAGIFVNANLYIKLDLPERPLTAEEANVYLGAYAYRLPEYFDLRQIAKCVPEINKALTAIGMKKYMLPEDVLDKFWCKESLGDALEKGEAGNTEEKRVLLIGYKQNVNYKYLFIEDVWKNVSLG